MMTERILRPVVSSKIFPGGSGPAGIWAGLEIGMSWMRDDRGTDSRGLPQIEQRRYSGLFGIFGRARAMPSWISRVKAPVDQNLSLREVPGAQPKAWKDSWPVVLPTVSGCVGRDGGPGHGAGRPRESVQGQDGGDGGDFGAVSGAIFQPVPPSPTRSGSETCPASCR